MPKYARHPRIPACFALAAHLLVCGTGNHAAATSALVAVDPPQPRTPVYFTMSVNALTKINSVDSSFFTDFYVAYLWRDDRLVGIDTSSFNPETMFTPAPEFVNALGDFEVSLLYKVYNGSTLPAWPGFATPPPPESIWVLATGRKQNEFAAVLNLEEFPFDWQTAQIIMESSAWTSDEVFWVASDKLRNAFAATQVDAWDKEGSSMSVADQTYEALSETYSRMTLSLVLRRQSAYYMSRIVTNVILLVIMACGVSFINALEADRLGFVQACFLGVVSWLFIIVSDTPRVGYLTRLDTFTNASFAAIFVMFIYNAVHAGYFKTIDKLTGYKSGSDGEPGGFVQTSRSFPAEEDGIELASATVVNPIRAGIGAADAGADSSSSGAKLGTLVNRHDRVAALDTAVGVVENEAPVKRLSLLETQPVIGKFFATPGPLPAATAGSLPVSGMSSRMLRERRCRTWPCSYHQYWDRWNPHRRLDFVVTACVLAAYAVAVAAALGRPTSPAS